MSARHADPPRGLMSTARSPLFDGKFGRLFRSLPPAAFGASEAENIANLTKLGAAMSSDADPADPKDGKDDEESGIPALYTYLGQFIDHDLTFDPASSCKSKTIRMHWRTSAVRRSISTTSTGEVHPINHTSTMGETRSSSATRSM